MTIICWQVFSWSVLPSFHVFRADLFVMSYCLHVWYYLLTGTFSFRLSFIYRYFDCSTHHQTISSRVKPKIVHFPFFGSILTSLSFTHIRALNTYHISTVNKISIFPAMFDRLPFYGLYFSLDFAKLLIVTCSYDVVYSIILKRI